MSSVIQRLARAGHKGAKALMAFDAFNPDQPRDEKGMWSGAESAASISEHQAASSFHEKQYAKTGNTAHAAAAAAHRNAAYHAGRSATSFNTHTMKLAQAASEKARTATRAAREIQSVQRTTQKEMPAVKEAKVEQLAPHTTLPVGNAKPTRMGSDPRAKTQELPAMIIGRGRMMASRENDPRALSAKEEDAREARELARGDRVPFMQGPTQASGYPGNPAREGSGRTLSRQDRAQAAAASAGEWASRALNVASRGKDLQGRNLNNKYQRTASMIENGRLRGKGWAR